MKTQKTLTNKELLLLLAKRLEEVECRLNTISEELKTNVGIVGCRLLSCKPAKYE